MSIILKSIAILTILSVVTSGSNGQQMGGNPDVFALADKLSDLFSAISNTKLTEEEKFKLMQFQETLMKTWYTLSGVIQSIEPGKTLDAYIALIKNQKELFSQMLNVFNLDQLMKWSELVTDVLKNVTTPNNNNNNCNGTCTLPPWNSNSTTWYPTGSYHTANTTGFPFVTEFPFYNFTTFFPSNWTDSWNWTTGSWNGTTGDLNGTTDNWWWTTGSWNGTTGDWNGTTDNWWWTTGSWNGTTDNWWWTTGSWNGTTGSWNGTTDNWGWTTGSWNGTTGSWNGTTGSWNGTTGFTTPSSNSSSAVFIDSEFCKFYSLADCTNRIEISLLCPAMCRCSNHKCQNDGTIAIHENSGQCQCLCKAGFQGNLCENSLCSEKEYCSYFNDSYCTVAMINENCPKLCGKC